MTLIAFPGHDTCCLRSYWPLVIAFRHGGRRRSLARILEMEDHR